MIHFDSLLLMYASHIHIEHIIEIASSCSTTICAQMSYVAHFEKSSMVTAVKKIGSKKLSHIIITVKNSGTAILYYFFFNSYSNILDGALE